MTTDDLKEQLLSTWTRIHDRLQDLPAYQQGKDRFEALAPQMQRTVVLGAIALVFLIMLFIPWSWHGESSDFVTQFEERRNVVRELLKVSREVAEVPDIPAPPPASALQSQIESRVQGANLLPEQIKGINAGADGSALVPGEKSAGTVSVSLWKLNLTQLIQIGTALGQISPSVKLTALEVTANKEDAHYLDAVIRVTALAVPDFTAPPAEEEPRAGRKGRQ